MMRSRIWSPPSSLGFVLLYAGAMIFFLVHGVNNPDLLNPDLLTISLFFFTFGLFGTWRQYVRWRRAKGESPFGRR